MTPLLMTVLLARCKQTNAQERTLLQQMSQQHRPMRLYQLMRMLRPKRRLLLLRMTL